MSKMLIDDVGELTRKAGEIRKKLCLGAHRIGNIHLGGPLSATDVAVAVYYKYLKFDPDNLDDPKRNTFVLSKGHNGILLYTIFCDMGMYNWDVLLDTYNTIGNPFGAHPNRKHVKGIEVSTGSLGHGLSWCIGIAHANRDKGIAARQFCLLGDGEMEEGSNWEAIMYAASRKMSSIVAIVDNNNCSASFMSGENIIWNSMADCWRAFGWEVHEIDGTNMAEIDKTLASLPPVDIENPGKPICIIANTTKGQGVKFMSDRPYAWHIGGLDSDKLNECIELIDSYTEEQIGRI